MMERASAEISQQALRHNYRFLQQQVSAECMAVIKANAYGHGIEHVVPALLECGCYRFAVSDAQEGLRLRLLLADRPAEIILLAGIINLQEALICRTQGLIPVLSAHWQVPLLWQAGYREEVWLKVDTGMARTGSEDPVALRQSCEKAKMRPTMLMSHLACADLHDHPMNAMQCAAFMQWHRLMPDLRASLLNSAGIMTRPEYAFDIARPGIALYGATPCAEVTQLQPVMHFSAPIMQIRELKAGESVSYGASFQAKKAMRIAVIRAGYADGVSRGLSNIGCVQLGEHRLPIVGRVCMDYCMVDLEDMPAGLGDRVSFWGVDYNVNHVADQLATIAYELLTHVGERVPRISV